MKDQLLVYSGTIVQILTKITSQGKPCHNMCMLLLLQLNISNCHTILQLHTKVASNKNFGGSLPFFLFSVLLYNSASHLASWIDLLD